MTSKADPPAGTVPDVLGASPRTAQEFEPTAGDDFAAVAVAFVDNAGISRAKIVPQHRIGKVAESGVGISQTLGVYCADDHVTHSAPVPGSRGDLRLRPDLSGLRPLPAHTGWGWAPADQATVDGEDYPGCQRRFLRRAVKALEKLEITALASIEIEWFMGPPEMFEEPAVRLKPAYGVHTAIAKAPVLNQIESILRAGGLEVEQLHAEYGVGQFELSLAATDPVSAADHNAYARTVIKTVAEAHGLAASLSPYPLAGELGSGSHVHISLQRHGIHLFAGGPGPYGLTDDAQAFLAGVLEHLPAMLPVLAGSPVSSLRLRPDMWAGHRHGWGHEDRASAVRLITHATSPAACNAEIKVVDASANPYLAFGAILTAGSHGITAQTRLSPEDAAAPNLPTDPAQVLSLFAADTTLAEAMGQTLHANLTAVRTSELQRSSDADDHQRVHVHRWCY